MPEELTVQKEVVLNVLGYTNHPQYDMAKGPVAGFDIAVYKVDDSPLQAKGVVSLSSGIWPACFPKETYVKGVPGVVSGWRDPIPSYFDYRNSEQTSQAYRLLNLELRQARMELLEECEDPEWMTIANSTFYPRGVICARDPSASSCLHFGNSGSPLLLPFAGWLGGPRRFSWVGSLSMYKGCDQATTVDISDSGSIREAMAGENPGIFTQATCFLPWIAKEYGMELSPDLKRLAGQCSPAKGRMEEPRLDFCKTNLGTKCDFDKDYQIQIPTLDPIVIKMDKCKLIGVEGYVSVSISYLYSFFFQIL